MSEAESSAQNSSSATPESPGAAPSLAIVPAHVVVLLLLAVAGLVAGHDAESAYRSGQEAKAFTTDIRRAVAFGLLFNFSIALALLVSWLIELITTLTRLVRKSAPAGQLVLRVGVALLPLLVFGVGHRIVNPWLPDLVRQLGSLARGG